MKLFWNTIIYRLKSHVTTVRGIAVFALAMLLAVSPFIGLIVPDAPIPIGWIDEDDTEFSHMLRQRVDALEVVSVFDRDRETLIANLQTGKIEGVLVIKEGFEESIRAGEFEGTLEMLRSPYSTAAGVIGESVGSEALALWLTCESANAGQTLGDDELYAAVFEDALAEPEEPILSLVRSNEAASPGEVTPIRDAAYSSLYLLAAFACFYLLTGMALTGRGRDFAARLKSRAFSAERYRLAVGIADGMYILPCAAVPLIAMGAANAGHLILPLLVMFVLYVAAFGGIASLVSRIGNRTALMLTISVITIANVMFGSMLVKLPQAGAFRIFTYVFPSRLLSSIEQTDALFGIAGLAVCAAVYIALPFIFRKRNV